MGAGLEEDGLTYEEVLVVDDHVAVGSDQTSRDIDAILDCALPVPDNLEDICDVLENEDEEEKHAICHSVVSSQDLSHHSMPMMLPEAQWHCSAAVKVQEFILDQEVTSRKKKPSASPRGFGSVHFPIQPRNLTILY